MFVKHVHFSMSPPKVYILMNEKETINARTGPWERIALDRNRFQNRIKLTEKNISWVLAESHRLKMYQTLYS